MSTKNNSPNIIFEQLAANGFFALASKENLLKIVEMDYCRQTQYSRGDIIISPNDNDKRIILIVSGSADVYSHKKGDGIMLRKLPLGGISGVSNLFADTPFESYIVAHEKTEVISVDVAAIKFLIENDIDFTYGYIAFLSDRICYLNKKIKYITAKTPEGSLARYLDSASDNDEFTLPLPMNSIADVLNIGRASLYRAMDNLALDGFILRDGKEIKIVNRQKMLESYL